MLGAGVCALANACGGDDFHGGPVDAAGGDGHGGEMVTTPSGGDPGVAGSQSDGGMTEPGGAPNEGGVAGAGGAGGAPPSSAPIVVVQSSRTSIVTNADPSLTLSALPQAGNALIVGISCFSDLDNCIIPDGGVTDNQGNTYALVVEGASIVSSDTHGSRPYLFIAQTIPAPTGAFTITVNPNGTPDDNVQNFAWGVIEVSGLAPNAVDQTGRFPNTCCFESTTVETDGATTQANELAVAVHTARSNDNDFNYGHDAAWTERQLNDDGVSQASQHSLVTRVLTEPGVVSHTWTHDEPSRGVSAIIATFRGAAN
jgi:hypothetical protein